MTANDPLKSAALGLKQLGILQQLHPLGEGYPIEPPGVMNPHVIVIGQVAHRAELRRLEEEIALVEARAYLARLQAYGPEPQEGPWQPRHGPAGDSW